MYWVDPIGTTSEGIVLYQALAADHPSTFVSDVRSLKSACMDVGYNARLPGRSSALWLFKHWTFYQISPFSHSYPDQAETLHLVPCGGPQFFHAHMSFLAVAYRTKFKP